MAKYCVDPVCKCEVEEETAEHESEYQGKKVKFCSVECKQEFDEHPSEYLGKRFPG